MYCIFDIHKNGKDFDYCVAGENKTEISGETYSRITIPKGKYVQVEFMKRSHTASSLIVLYNRNLWIELNGYESRNITPFILYDERLHRNNQKYGCKEGKYLPNEYYNYLKKC
jgi:predicted transcriptional regulator YdeE